MNIIDWVNKQLRVGNDTVLEDSVEAQELQKEMYRKKHNRLCVGFIVGHTKPAKGAYAAEPIGLHEYDFWSQAALDLLNIGDDRGHHPVLIFRDDIGRNVAYQLMMQRNPDLVCELHFNAYNGHVRGSEVLYYDDQDNVGLKEKELAEHMSAEISRLLGNPNRGAKERKSGERAHVNVDQTRVVPSIIPEPFFGDNFEDAKAAMENYWPLLHLYWDCFEWWSERVSK